MGLMSEDMECGLKKSDKGTTIQTLCSLKILKHFDPNMIFIYELFPYH